MGDESTAQRKRENAEAKFAPSGIYFGVSNVADNQSLHHPTQSGSTP